MYLRDRPTGALEQGDLCIQVPLPVLLDESKVVVNQTTTTTLTEALENGQLENPAGTYIASVAKFSTVLILSQTCDLLDLETEPGRILVVPALPEGDSPLMARWQDAYVSNIDGEKLAKAVVTKPSQVPAKITQTIEAAEKSRATQLRRLWLGEIGGAFPLRELATGEPRVVSVPRSVCHFDYATSLPQSYLVRLSASP
jgi:hypothetical protein